MFVVVGGAIPVSTPEGGGGGCDTLPGRDGSCPCNESAVAGRTVVVVVVFNVFVRVGSKLTDRLSLKNMADEGKGMYTSG